MSSQKKPAMGGVGASYDEPNFNPRGGYGATPGYENEKRPFNYEENTGNNNNNYYPPIKI